MRVLFQILFVFGSQDKSSHTPQDLSIASTLLRSTVSVIFAPFFMEAICSFASLIAATVSALGISS